MIEVFIDFEARSEVDLVKAGQHNYMTHPSTEPLCLGWAVGDGPVQITPFVEPQDEGLFRTQMHFKTTEDLSPLYDAVEQGALIVAHNAGFDRGLWDRALALPFTPLEQWACSAAASRHYGAPGALSDACEFLGLPPPKLTAANVDRKSVV